MQKHDNKPMEASSTTALIPIEEKIDAAEGKMVSGIRVGYNHGFQNFLVYNSPKTMIRSEGYL